MSGLVLIVVVAVAVAIGAVLRPTRTVGPVSPSDAWLAAARHAGRVTASAWAALLAAPVLMVAVVVPELSGLTVGLSMGLLPAAGGAAFLAVHAVGELTWPRPTGIVRRAALARRGLRDITPAGLGALVLGWSAALLALLALCAAVATDDGRALPWRHGPLVTGEAGPFPGWFYGRWLVLAVAVLLAGCIGVLLLVARRPAVSDASADDDTALRRLSARRVLGGVQLVLGWTLAGCLGVASRALHAVQGGAVDGVALADPTVVAVAAAGVVVAVVVAVAAAVVAGRSAAPPGRAAAPRRSTVDLAAQPHAS
ncbi:hypothetical protein [Cellulomonas humilata]|uniref:Uncharacterized protein n=1 Tax=Cellulomonas humilata TaxID=144055 RepID=A0ABU0EJF2_9CELL|nr:hypothetical protein [Cellulomonas humilata]MDQ0375309.1 hypothetical protein [Cellulomonas humilata]